MLFKLCMQVLKLHSGISSYGIYKIKTFRIEIICKYIKRTFFYVNMVNYKHLKITCCDQSHNNTDDIVINNTAINTTLN